MHTQKVISAMNARQHLANDFFGGWEEDDCLLFQRYHCEKSGVANCLTDYFGVRTPIHCIPWVSHLGGSVASEMPIPDDGVRAEAIEYVAALRSIDSCKQSRYSMIELGANYAPWSTFTALLAARKGVEQIEVIALEASSFLYTGIEDNLNANGLSGGLTSRRSSTISFAAINAAISTSKGTAFFPRLDSFHNCGSRVSKTDTKNDYVGRCVANESVNLLTLKDVWPENPFVDFLHIDIQGDELALIRHALDFLQQHVRYMFIGTHSRQIEADLLTSLQPTSFTLVRERPCAFVYQAQNSDFSAMTVRDGGQIWLNTSFLT